MGFVPSGSVAVAGACRGIAPTAGAGGASGTSSAAFASDFAAFVLLLRASESFASSPARRRCSARASNSSISPDNRSSACFMPA